MKNLSTLRDNLSLRTTEQLVKELDSASDVSKRITTLKRVASIPHYVHLLEDRRRRYIEMYQQVPVGHKDVAALLGGIQAAQAELDSLINELQSLDSIEKQTSDRIKSITEEIKRRESKQEKERSQFYVGKQEKE
jgi:hypothetical protein